MLSRSLGQVCLMCGTDYNVSNGLCPTCRQKARQKARRQRPKSKLVGTRQCPQCGGFGHEDCGPARVPYGALTARGMAEAMGEAYPQCRRCRGRGYI